MSDGTLSVPGSNLPVESSGMEDFSLSDLYGSMGENIDRRSEIKIARLCIMQAKSPEIDAETPGYQQGQIVNSMTREILSRKVLPPWLIAKGVKPEEMAGKEVHCMALLPVFKLPREAIKWIKREERKEGEAPYEFKTLDFTDPRVRAGVWKQHGGTFGIAPEERKKAPPVTINCNVLMMPVDLETGTALDTFVIGTFAKTSADCGQVLVTAMETCAVERIPPWQRIQWLYTAKKTYPAPGGKTNTCFIYQSTRGPLVKDVCGGKLADLFPAIIGMAKALMNKETGVEFQQMMLNASDLTNDGNPDADAHGDGTTVTNDDGTGTADPFTADNDDESADSFINS